jgi:hypothetical protein
MKLRTTLTCAAFALVVGGSALVWNLPASVPDRSTAC